MLKIRSDAIKTLAKTVIQARDKTPKDFLAEAKSPEVVYFNRKLREAFGLFAMAQNVPLPTSQVGQSAANEAESDSKTAETAIPKPVAEKNKTKEELQHKQEEAKKAEEEAARKAEEERKKAEEERLRQEEEVKKTEEKKREEQRAREEEETAREAEEERLRQLAALEAERAKKAEDERARRREEETKKAEEKKKAEEEEREKAEGKKREEEEAASKAEEERLRQLAALEAERAKKAEEEAARRREEAKKAEEKKRAEEEQRKIKEEERAANSLPLTIKKLLAKLEEKKTAENKKAAEIPTQKIPLEQKRRILESKIAMIRKSELAIVEEKEREIETKAAGKRNELEKNSDPAKEKTLKQALWQIEDSRKEIEKQRWGVEDKINKIKIDADSVDRQIAEKTRQLETSREEILQISGQEALVRFTAEKIRAEEEILKIIKEKELLAPELAAAKNKKNDIEKKLADLAEKESLISRRLNDIEAEEARAKDLPQRREIEKNRWQANNDLKSIVEEKWRGEEKLNLAAADFKSIQERANSLDAKIESIQSKITGAEMELEEKELPVHTLRDAIRRLLEENLVNFNPKIISRIVQIGKTEGKTNGESKTPAIVKNEPKPAVTTEKNPPEKTEREKKTTTETARPQGNGAASDNNTVKKEASKPIAVSEEKKPAPDIALRAEKSLPKENAAPAAKNGPAEKESENPPGEEFSDKVKTNKDQSALKDAGPAVNPAVRQDSGETKTPPREEIAKTAGRNGNIYREQVEAAPAKNIRTFAQDNPPETAPPVGEKKESPRPAENEPARPRPAENELETNRDNPAPNPETRWQQIKKTTLPGTAAFAPPIAGAEESRAQMAAERPAAKSKRGNLLARLLIVFAVVAVLGIVLAIVFSKNSGKTPAIVKNESKPAATTEKNPPEEPAAPAAIVTTATTVTIYVDSIANVPSSISPYMRKKFDANGYHSLLIVDRSTGKKIGLKQFFNAYKLNAPAVFYNSLKDDCEFFIYANNGKNRLGFATEITKSEMIEPAMAGWEGSIAKDAENLFRLLGRKTFAEDDTLRFTDSAAAGTAYKVMQFSPAEDEFAIAWANYRQTYFIFSTSNNSMAKIFNQLPK